MCRFKAKVNCLLSKKRKEDGWELQHQLGGRQSCLTAYLTWLMWGCLSQWARWLPCGWWKNKSRLWGWVCSEETVGRAPTQTYLSPDRPQGLCSGSNREVALCSALKGHANWAFAQMEISVEVILELQRFTLSEMMDMSTVIRSTWGNALETSFMHVNTSASCLYIKSWELFGKNSFIK